MAGGVNIDHAKLQAIMHARTEEAVMKGATAFRDHVRREILVSGRMRTGQMYRDIHVLPGPPTPESSTALVIPATPQFRFQDQGTHGSRARPGHFLRFMPKGSTVYVFAKKVRGVTPAHFLEKAKLHTRASDFA